MAEERGTPEQPQEANCPAPVLDSAMGTGQDDEPVLTNEDKFGSGHKRDRKSLEKAAEALGDPDAAEEVYEPQAPEGAAEEEAERAGSGAMEPASP